MRPATEEIMLDYCIAVLNAQTEEELELVKQEIVALLKKYDYSEEEIQNFFIRADEMVEDIKENESTIQNDIYAETNTEVGTPSSIPRANQNNNTMQGALIGGIGLTALISVLALKQKILNKNKENEDNKTL